MSERRKIRLYAYFSSKGGVGKSTLSVATAWLAASTPGREAVLLDLDLWGSSLGDGLPLCAPVVPQDDRGVLNFGAAPTGTFLSRYETLRERHRRRFADVFDGSEPPFLPYVNDAMFVKAKGNVLTAPMDHFLWRLEGPADPADLPLRWLPSSPLSDDRARVGAWLVDVKDLQIWAARVWWVILTLIAQRPGLTDIVCDLPPGMVGLGLPFYLMLSAHAGGRLQPEGFPELDPSWDLEILPALVTTPDRQALAISAESFIALRAETPALTLIVNRAQSGSGTIRERLETHFAPFYGLDPFRLDRQARLVDERRELQLFDQAFRGLDGVDPTLLATLRETLRVPEVGR